MNRHRALGYLFEHDLFGKPLHAFPDHALARWKAETNCVGCQLSTTVQTKLPHEIFAMFPGGKRAMPRRLAMSRFVAP